MNNIIADSGDVVYYVVRVHGQDVTAPVATQQLAEMKKMELEPEQQALAEVVPVTADGKQILFD